MSLNDTNMMSRMTELVEKYDMGEEGKAELISILNESLVLISSEILKSAKISNKSNKTQKGDNSMKRYKSKKAEEYAEEHNIEITEFEMNEISKKDVENLIREKTKNSEKMESKVSGEKVEKKQLVKKEKVICCGINKKGEACKSVGTIQPEGAKKKYCFRHAEDWKSFECSSDSSDSDNEESKELVSE